MSKSRESFPLFDLPTEMVLDIPETLPHNEATKCMAELSGLCKSLHGLFNSGLDIAKALHHAAFARKEDVDSLLAMLSANPELLLKRGNVITPSGLRVRGVTIYECVLGAGDFNLAKKIEPCFAKIENGESERLYQYERYRPHIEGILTQKPDDLTWLFEIIKQSSAEDVAEELKTGDQYDKNYQSRLRDALNKFREAKLDPKVRVLSAPRMHCNYQNLIHAYTMLDAEWNNLLNGHNNDKLQLVIWQMIGFIQLVELPGYERCLFARGQVKEAAAGKEVERSIIYQYGTGALPNFDISLVVTHSGVGFDSYISIFGAQCLSWSGLGGMRSFARPELQTYVEQNFKLGERIQPTRENVSVRICEAEVGKASCRSIL